MRKTLTSIHIALLLLLTIYAGEQIVRLGVKIVNPAHESVKFWNPGLGMILVTISFVLLLGILGCSTGIIKNQSWPLLGGLHSLWLICFTWFGWTTGGPFTLQELVRVDLSDPAAVSNARMTHFLQALAVYITMVLISSIPPLIRWLGGGTPGDRSDQPKAQNPVLHH